MNQQDKLSHFIDNLQGFLDNSQDVILIKDTEFNYVGGSRGFSDLFNLNPDKRKFIGGTDEELTFFDIYRQHDQEVMTGKQLVTIEPFTMSNKSFLTSNATRFPILDDQKNIIGIFAQANILPMNTIGDVLSNLFFQDKKNTALSQYTPEAYRINDFPQTLNLTKRESETLFLLIRCKSAKEIGMFLAISSRTVEIYIENIKRKMNVSTRSEIIEKAIENNMLNIIPEKNILMSLCNHSDKWKDFLSLT